MSSRHKAGCDLVHQFRCDRVLGPDYSPARKNRPLYTGATRIVDHGHACDHLRAAMTAYYGDKSVEGRAEYARLRILLRDQPGGVDAVITELARLARKLGKL